MTGIDRRSVARVFRRAVRTLAHADFLYAEIRSRLLERLDLVQLEPALAVDLGSGDGTGAAALAARYPGARILAVDLLPEMVRSGAAAPALGVCADAARLPLADGAADLAFASLLLPWCQPVQPVLAEVCRVLRFPGLFSFATFGVGTLAELRRAWAAADPFSHVHDYPDMHDLGDALVQAGFAEPVLDCETIRVSYAGVERLAAELRAMGASNLSAGRNPGLTGRSRWARMQAAYESLRGDDGRIPATVEIIYGQAWAPGGAARRLANGEIAVPVGRIGRRQRPH